MQASEDKFHEPITLWRWVRLGEHNRWLTREGDKLYLSKEAAERLFIFTVSSKGDTVLGVNGLADLYFLRRVVAVFYEAGKDDGEGYMVIHLNLNEIGVEKNLFLYVPTLKDMQDLLSISDKVILSQFFITDKKQVAFKGLLKKVDVLKA